MTMNSQRNHYLSQKAEETDENEIEYKDVKSSDTDSDYH